MRDGLHCSVGKGLMQRDQRRQRKVTLAKSKNKKEPNVGRAIGMTK